MTCGSRRSNVLKGACKRAGGGVPRFDCSPCERTMCEASQSVAFLLADLGVTRTRRRPHVSNGNPSPERRFPTGLTRTRTRPRARLLPLVQLEALRGKLTDWQGLLHQEPAPARQALRALLAGRLLFTPHDQHYIFEGEGTITPVIAGTARQQHIMVAPTGFEPVIESRPRFRLE